jgi:D-alanine-D-alanine ligase
MSKLTVCVLFGGQSAEHDVSCVSAANVVAALKASDHTLIRVRIERDGRWALLDADDAVAESANATLLTRLDVDVVFPVLHGPMGEDGTIQGLLEVLDLPYVGCGVTASAVAMDKDICKAVCRQAGVPVVDWFVITAAQWRENREAIVERACGEFGLGIFVKPANMGSSVGVSSAHTPEELEAAIDLALRFDRRVLIESALLSPRELEVSVLGNDDVAISAVGEVTPGAEFYTYADKYEDGLAGLHIPAQLDAVARARVIELAECVYRCIDGAGLSRIDFLMSEGEIYLNEVNTLPGFTAISMYPKLWEHSGISADELADRLITLAIARHRERHQLKAAKPE